MSTVIHRCAQCNHKDGDHAEGGGGRCGFGGCPCRRTRDAVRAEEPPVTIPTFAGYDHATKSWARR